jgi:dTDP-4-amino-4,6-dideoxygalactose transaminase
MVRIKKHIPLARPYFDKEEEVALFSVIRSKWVMQGARVAEFEEKFADYIGSKYAVTVSSGTAALHLSLLATGINERDKVIVPSFSFIATANAVVYCSAKPVFIDIDLQTYNISPEKIEEYIVKAIKKGDKSIKAIMPVHQLGMPADMDSIMAIAKKYRLRVIEDAACALGSEYKGQKVGNVGDIGCFSFHPRKIITTGEGGMVTTNNKKFAEKIRLLRNHGMAISSNKREEGYPIIGYNYRMTDLQAAIGLMQMRKLKYILNKRRTLANRYNKLLEGIEWLERPHIPSYANPNYQSYIIRIKGDNYKIRDCFLSELMNSGISCKAGVQAIHLEKCYKGKYGGDELINTKKASFSTILLPLYTELEEAEQDKVVNNLKRCYSMISRL